jgi:hypothetical protein
VAALDLVEVNLRMDPNQVTNQIPVPLSVRSWIFEKMWTSEVHF